MKHLTFAAGVIGLLLLGLGPAGAQDQLYVTEYKYQDPALRAMGFDGSNVEDLFDPENPIPPTDWLLVGVAVDDAAGKVYWLHGSTPGRIRRANLDGSDQESLVSGLKIPRGLALDLVGGKMYWSAAPPEGNAGGLVQRANLDGTDLETVYLDPDYDPVSSKIGRPTVDPVNGWVYFASNQRIVRVNLDGPPFEIFTVVTGVSTARAVDLDVTRDHIYWIGADTIEDVVVRARFDNTGFTVIYDLSPDSGGSNGLSDIALDLAGETYFLCDDLRKIVGRGKLDGSGFGEIYTSPAGFAPSALTLNVPVLQPMTDCNDNQVRDIDEIMSGSSLDCNHNGIPDECEEDPCVPPEYLIDQSADITNPGRQIGGAPENQRWIVFQPFDVEAGGGEVGEIHLNGVTWTYRPEGFTATLLPDNGHHYPDETNPLAAGDAVFRFSPEWVTIPMVVTLPEGRHWIQLTANDENAYVASVSTVSEGLPSMSRSGLGNDFFGQPPIGLRIVERSTSSVPEQSDSETARAPYLRLTSSNPSRGPMTLQLTLPEANSVHLKIYDVRGRQVCTLMRGSLPAGEHDAVWDGKDDRGTPVIGGLYFARLSAGGAQHSVRFLHL